MDAALAAQIARRKDVIGRIADILTGDLHLQIPADAIDVDAALFGSGLGLDSVDGLELVVSTERAFAVRIPEEDLRSGLRTVNSLADLVLDLQDAREAA